MAEVRPGNVAEALLGGRPYAGAQMCALRMCYMKGKACIVAGCRRQAMPRQGKGTLDEAECDGRYGSALRRGRSGSLGRERVLQGAWGRAAAEVLAQTWAHLPPEVTGLEVPGRPPWKAASTPPVPGRLLPVPGRAKPVRGRPAPVMGRVAGLMPPCNHRAVNMSVGVCRTQHVCPRPDVGPHTLCPGPGVWPHWASQDVLCLHHDAIRQTCAAEVLDAPSSTVSASKAQLPAGLAHLRLCQPPQSEFPQPALCTTACLLREACLQVPAARRRLSQTHAQAAGHHQ